MNDVSHQKHYMDLPLQPIVIMLRDFTPEEFMGFLKGNAIKYLLRADGKNGTEDYAKAAVYTAWVKEFAETGTITVPGKEENMEKREKDGCNECDRKGVLKCMEEAEDHLPDDVSGFGAHDDYVMGLVDGARAAIRGVRSEIETLHNEALEFGLQKED